MADKFDNKARIASISCPSISIHGKLDKVIPFWHGESLYSQMVNPKGSLWVENAGHDDLVYQAKDRYWDMLSKYLNDLKK